MSRSFAQMHNAYLSPPEYPDLPCDTCGGDPSDCDCPECPVCGESGNPYCYDAGHLTYTTRQLIGRTKLEIYNKESELSDLRFHLGVLEAELKEI